MLSFKNKYTHEERESEYLRMKSKFPERYCIILEPANKNTMDIDKHKYLVPKEMTMNMFHQIIRKRIKLPEEMSIIFFVNNTIPAMTTLISGIYNEHKDKDGFLYIQYAQENTFGSFPLYE